MDAIDAARIVGIRTALLLCKQHWLEVIKMKKNFISTLKTETSSRK